MTFNFTSLSSGYASFAKNFGEPFVTHPSVYKTFFEASINDIKGYDAFRGFNALGQQLDVEIGMVMNKKTPNAYCTFDQNKHYVLIEHLFPIGLLEFFHRLLANPNVLPDLGNTKLDTKLQRIHETSFLPGFEILSGGRMIVSLGEIAEYYGPQCPQRRQAAMLLYQHAMTFLYAHELTHAMAGHVLYVKQLMGAQCIRECSLDSEDDYARRVNCFLEHQADNGAAWSVIGQYVILTRDDREMIDQVNDAALRIIGSSLLLYYMALIDINYAAGDTDVIYQWYDHPASAARAMFVTNVPMMQMPKDLVTDQAKKVIEQACLIAKTELLRMACAMEILRPYNWLRKENFFDLFNEKMQLSESEKKKLSKPSNLSLLDKPVSYDLNFHSD